MELTKRYDKPIAYYVSTTAAGSELPAANLRLPHLHRGGRDHPGTGDELSLLQPHAGDPQCRTNPNLRRQPGRRCAS